MKNLLLLHQHSPCSENDEILAFNTKKRKLYSHHEQSKAFEIPVSLSEHKLYLDQNTLLSPRGVPTYKKLQSKKNKI